MNYKGKTIVFSDLDSTLLKDNHVFFKKIRQVIKDLDDQGIMLIPITARSTKDVLEQGRRLGLNELGEIVAENNGSQIFDFKNSKWIVNEYLPDELVKDVFETFYNIYKAKVYFNGDDPTYVFNKGNQSKYWAQIIGINYLITHEFEEKIKPITVLKLGQINSIYPFQDL